MGKVDAWRHAFFGGASETAAWDRSIRACASLSASAQGDGDPWADKLQVDKAIHAAARSLAGTDVEPSPQIIHAALLRWADTRATDDIQLEAKLARGE